jgi:membrane fusion protein (multidrug efflux system)
VQRVPVRIALDPRELAAHPLQIGLSMQAEVDTRDRSGSRMPEVAQTANTYETEVFHSVDQLANERVKSIIAANEAAAAPVAVADPGRGGAPQPHRIARTDHTGAAVLRRVKVQ